MLALSLQCMTDFPLPAASVGPVHCLCLSVPRYNPRPGQGIVCLRIGIDHLRVRRPSSSQDNASVISLISTAAVMSSLTRLPASEAKQLTHEADESGPPSLIGSEPRVLIIDGRVVPIDELACRQPSEWGQATTRPYQQHPINNALPAATAHTPLRSTFYSILAPQQSLWLLTLSGLSIYPRWLHLPSPATATPHAHTLSHAHTPRLPPTHPAVVSHDRTPATIIQQA